MVSRMCRQIGSEGRGTIHVVKLDIENLMPSEYSQLLMTQSFWRMLVGEKILVYQEDTVLFHGRIARFLEYDYIGAPWPSNQDDNSHGVGNGGFSLRSKSKLIECIENVPVSELRLGSCTIDYMRNTGSTVIPEDVFFSKAMIDKQIGKVAHREVAIDFSQETQKSCAPVGGHCFWLADGGRLVRPYVNTYILGTSYTHNNSDHRSGWAPAIRGARDKGIIQTTRTRSSDMILVDCLEHHFLFNHNDPIETPWVGIVHFPAVDKAGVIGSLDPQGLDEVLASAGPSMKHCRGIITLSEDLKQQVMDRLPWIQVDAIKHPIQLLQKKFSIDRFRRQLSYGVVQAGSQFRQVSTIYRLKTCLPKLWVGGTRTLHMVHKELGLESLPQSDVNVLDRLSNEDYDDLLLTNIIMVPLWYAAANNTVLECIEMNVPAFVTRLPATEEYLGVRYPLFYSDIREIEEIIDNQEVLYEKLAEATTYLSRMDKTDIRYDRFNSDLLRVINR